MNDCAAHNGRRPHRQPDYRIDGEIFDCFAPKTEDARGIWKEIAKQVYFGRVFNIVLNLTDATVTVAEVREELQSQPIAGLGKLWVISQDSRLVYLKNGPGDDLCHL